MDSELNSDQIEELPSKGFHSTNLEFTSYNSREHDRFFKSFQEYSSSIIDACASSPQRMDLKFTSSVAKHLQRNSHLFMIIYGNTAYCEDIPIGTLFFESSHRDMAHHRCSKLGIGILKEYQLYQVEAVDWALNWAFNSANLHRVEMTVPSWNTQMGKVCEATGFRIEGARRECYFKDGEWWDEVIMSVLKKEWKQREAARKK
ncbi:Acyl-CoA N-acyltransferase [Penicillium vulpinum]|uniref:N-acetyltransferase domain-containing protein n=1 Tax=Penicillium vulpinum TaxID=29845 RepID=A0A1V6S8Z0_9EURO|nr:Acyl-CoA N-acyltransferase [Penicillium vulpinum]KAJ5952283.1 Acyl-CoA N-acyltransferase [Penicillium vulpinum]OQE10240.1 hypothetical protein PENVUL_c004G04186 [Penicillium vulpinum]